MAILKKGSKGKDVQELQKLLNKNKAKPQLEVDGDFGKLTDAAVRAFQKKMKLSVDGKVGENTLATLKFGRPLPVMTVQDYTEKKAHLQQVWKDTQAGIAGMLKIKKELADLQSVWTKEAGIIDKIFIENYDHWKRLAEDSDELIKRQKAFEDLRTKDPAKAEKLLKECIAFDAEIRAVVASRIEPNRKKMSVSVGKMWPKLSSSIKTIKAELAVIEKRAF